MTESSEYASFPQRQVELDGVRKHYVDIGEGPPVVLVHGSPLSSFSFRHQIAALSKSFRVIAPDLHGFGQSNAPDAGTSFARQSEIFRLLLDHLALDSFRLLVHDWGGPIGVAAVAGQLERVKQLVLVNTTLRRSFRPPIYWKMFTAPLLADLLLVKLNVFSRGLPVLMAAARSKSVRKQYTRSLRAVGTRRTVLALERLTGYAELMTHVEQVLSALSMPTLILWGQPDAYFRRAELAWLVETLPHAVVREIAGGGHFPQEDAPQAVTDALLDFFS